MIDKIMSKNVIVLDENTNIIKIAKTMKENDIGIIPISRNKKIIGVLTDRDIVTKVLANNDEKIKNYITKKIVKINVDSDINEALEIMKKNKIKRLLVEKNNKLVGILSISDLLYYQNEKILETFKNIYTIDKNSDEYHVEIDEFEL